MSEHFLQRNILALAEAAKSDRVKTAALEQKVTALQAQVAMQVAEIQTMRQMLVSVMASRGTGPTSR